MISEIFSFLLSKPATFFENLGVISKISGTGKKSRPQQAAGFFSHASVPGRVRMVPAE